MCVHMCEHLLLYYLGLAHDKRIVGTKLSSRGSTHIADECQAWSSGSKLLLCYKYRLWTKASVPICTSLYLYVSGYCTSTDAGTAAAGTAAENIASSLSIMSRHCSIREWICLRNIKD